MQQLLENMPVLAENERLTDVAAILH